MAATGSTAVELVVPIVAHTNSGTRPAATSSAMARSSRSARIACFASVPIKRTCVRSSGPLASPEIEAAVTAENLSVVAVLSGNRNFESRIHPLVKASYLGSPPLVVAYALAGTVNIDLTKDPVGTTRDGKPVMLSELWPSQAEVNDVVQKCVQQELSLIHISEPTRPY